jgi:hypothetical protein
VAFYTPLTQDQLFGDFSTAYASAAALPAQLDAASTVGAIGTGVARVGERIDTQTEYIASIARLSTSSPNLTRPGVSPNVASWGLPFSVIPIGPVAATTTLILSTASPVSSAFSITPGLICATQTGVQFLVIADTTRSGFIGSVYVIASGQSTVAVSAICLTPGTVGNVLAGTINTLVSTTSSGPTLSLASVTNPSNVINGRDGETDGAYIQRFTATVSSGRVGTQAALLSAVAAVQTGLTYQYGDAINIDGSVHAAHFTIVVDVLGSSGGPGTTLLNEIKAAIDGGIGPSGKAYPQVRGAGTTRDILPPTEVPINTTGVLKLASGADSATVLAAANASMTAYLNNFPLSSGISAATIVPYSEVIAQLLTVPGVKYPSNVTIQAASGAAGTVDLAIGFGSRAVAGTPAFTTVA